MQRIIVYLDDAAYAREQLAPVDARTSEATHWVLVACAPRMTQHISKWVTHSARAAWRDKWADKLFREITPHLSARGDRFTTVVAKGSLPALTSLLSAEHSTSHVVDARRPRTTGAAAGAILRQ